MRPLQTHLSVPESLGWQSLLGVSCEVPQPKLVKRHFQTVKTATTQDTRRWEDQSDSEQE